MAHFLQETIAVLGCGHMGRAMVQGWLRAEALAPASIIATTKSAASAQKLRDELGIRATDGGNAEAATQASVIIVAVKPWLVAEVLDELELVVGPKQLLVSVAASIPASFLQARLHRKEVSIARAMPNLPVAFGQGVVGIAMGASPAEATARQALRERLEKLFAPLGQTVVLEDAQMDALTALAGSGPAYIYMVIEAMAMAGGEAWAAGGGGFAGGDADGVGGGVACEGERRASGRASRPSDDARGNDDCRFA